MQRRTKRRIALGVITVVAIGLAAAGRMFYLDWTYVETPGFTRSSETPARVVVVYYSRTGNTEGAAREIARYFDADLIPITAPRYTRDYGGWRDAANDADAEVTRTAIEHAQVDLSAYDLVVLGSPIWWFRPAPPLWTFVEEHDLAGADVLLFNTGNSRFEQEHIDRFEARIEARGGRLVDHLFIRRGRIYWQKSPEEVNAEVRAWLDARADTFSVFRER